MKHRVRWPEARLFSVVTGGDYKLVSPRSEVRLRQINDPASSYLRPDIAFEEYQRKMDGLLLLISERTGLPLTDLRDVPER